MKIHSLLFALLFSASCCAQNNVGSLQLKVHEPTIESSGIPKLIKPKTNYEYEHSVFNSVQDKNRNYWFSTTDGVYRFDGKLFHEIETMDGQSVKHVSCTMKDNDGNIWFGVDGGIIKYDGKTFSSLRFTDDYSNSLFLPAKYRSQSENLVGTILQDNNGAIWLSTNKNGIYRYNGKSLISLPLFDCPDENGEGSIFKDSKGNVWCIKGGCGFCHYCYRLDVTHANDDCINGTCKHDLKNAQELAANNKEIENLFSKVSTASSKNIDFTTFFEDKNGTLWFGTWDSGLYNFNGKQFTHFSGKDGINTSYIESILQVKNGNLWFATGIKSEDGFEGKGVFRYNGKTVTHFNSKDGLNSKGFIVSNSASRMLEDNDGKIWFISENGGGASCYNGKTFTAYSTKDGLTSDNVLNISKDDKGNLWFGTWGLGLCRYDAASDRFISYTEPLTKQ